MINLSDCPICGTAVPKREGRLYKYDNGNIIFEFVCPNCASLHETMLAGGRA